MHTPSKRKSQLEAFNHLLSIMDELREKCPWDKKQTLESLRHLTIEETFELSDAILDGDLEEIKKELGDILLHIVFYARIGAEKNSFDIADVINQLNEKLIRRHPHIYGNVKADDENMVKQNWEKIKLQEKGTQSVLGGVPKSLPAMIKAMRIQEKVRGVGFDWEDISQVWEKVEEEMSEFKDTFDVETNLPVDKSLAAGEFGDLLFSLINYARYLDINPEEALEKTNRKFIKRFKYLEQAAIMSGKSLAEMSLSEMDVFWEAAKKEEQKPG